jgi:hypothetical protein
MSDMMQERCAARQLKADAICQRYFSIAWLLPVPVADLQTNWPASPLMSFRLLTLKLLQIMVSLLVLP